MGGWNQYMWLVSCRRQGMLTQGHAPDPKCKLNISSFLTLPHLLDCLICTRTSVSTVLLVWMMGGWDRWGVVDSYQGLGGGTGGWYYLISHSFFHFSCVLLSFEQLFTYIYYILYIYIYIYIYIYKHIMLWKINVFLYLEIFTTTHVVFGLKF